MQTPLWPLGYLVLDICMKLLIVVGRKHANMLHVHSVDCVCMRRLAWMQYGFSFQTGLAAAKQLTAQRLTTCWRLKRWICRSSLKYLHFQDPEAEIYWPTCLNSSPLGIGWCDYHDVNCTRITLWIRLGFPMVYPSVFCCIWIGTSNGSRVWFARAYFIPTVFFLVDDCYVSYYTFRWCHDVIRCRFVKLA